MASSREQSGFRSGKSRSLPSASTAYQRPFLRSRLTTVESLFTLARFARGDDADDIVIWFREHHEEEPAVGESDYAPALLVGFTVVALDNAGPIEKRRLFRSRPVRLRLT
jgi:hypothetical protein